MLDVEGHFNLTQLLTLLLSPLLSTCRYTCLPVQLSVYIYLFVYNYLFILYPQLLGSRMNNPLIRSDRLWFNLVHLIIVDLFRLLK